MNHDSLSVMFPVDVVAERTGIWVNLGETWHLQ